MHDVFISFSFADQEKAEYICNTLTNLYHIPCWICTRDIDGGRRFKKLIPQAIKESKVVVFLQSADSLESREIPKEIGIAFENNKTIIPFRLDDCALKGDLEYDLYGIEYIDATVPTLDERIKDLAGTISRDIGIPLGEHKAAEAPAAPVLASSKIVCSQIFFGRDDVMEQIEEAFRSRDVVFLHGMGGIGKSEIARQYWRRNRDFYTTVVFARYEKSLASLIADDAVFKMEGVSRKTKSDNTPQTDEEYAEDKLRILKRNADSHTLIVIDNYDAVSDPFFEKLDEGGSYRILVTSRCEPERGKYPVIPVDEIDDAGLRRLFIEYANPNRTMIDENDPDFPELFELTNRHTLTLELTAKYMDEKGMDEIGEIVRLFREKKLEALSDSEKKDGYAVIRNLFRMTELNEQEKLFMRCLAMMPPAGVNQRMFRKWIGEAFSARARLADLSLIRVDVKAKSLALHPVVRDIVLNELKPGYEECRGFIDSCAMVGEDAIPLIWNLPYDDKSILLECFNSLMVFIPNISAETYPAYVNMSYLYNYIGTFEQTIKLHEKILAFVRNHFGENSAEATLIYSHIAWKYSSIEDYDQAIHYYKTAADWFYQQSFCYTKTREAHDVIKSCADNYYYLYRQTNNEAYREEALAYLKKASEYGNRMLAATLDASEHFRTHLKYQIDCACRNYFNIYFDEQKFDMAEKCLSEYYNAIAELSESTSGQNYDPDIAWYYHYLSQLNYINGNYGKALSAIQESYRLYLKCFSDKDSLIVQVLEELVKCYVKLKDYENATKYISTALDIATDIYTNDHPRIAALRALYRQIEQ